MKKIAMILLGLAAMSVSVAAYADNDRPIKFSELPANAQAFVTTNFAGIDVSWAQMDPEMRGSTYEVMMGDGSKIEFDRAGEWTEVERKTSAVPAAVVPTPILNHVAQHHAGAKIMSIERDRRGYEIKLANGIEMKFDKQYNMVKMDD